MWDNQGRNDDLLEHEESDFYKVYEKEECVDEEDGFDEWLDYVERTSRD